MEEFKISKIMLMTLPDGNSNLYDVSFDETIEVNKIKKQ